MDAGDFERTLPWKLWVKSRQFSHIVRNSYEYGDRPSALFAGHLHILAQSYEVLFKAILALDGVSESHLKNVYKHSLQMLWDAITERQHSSLFASCSDEEFESAREENLLSDEESLRRGFDVFKEHIAALSKLHGSESNFALRYHANDGEEGPNLPLLLGTLGTAHQKIEAEVALGRFFGRPLSDLSAQ